jgi:hypothetical protein
VKASAFFPVLRQRGLAIAFFLCATASFSQTPDALCLQGERKIDLIPKLPEFKKQEVGTCTFYGVCAAAENLRKIPPGEKVQPLSELYLALKHFESNPTFLKEAADQYKGGKADGILSGNQISSVASSLKGLGLLPVAKDPTEEAKIMKKINEDMGKDLNQDQYQEKFRGYLKDYQSQWDWNSPQVLDTSKISYRRVQENTESPILDHLAMMRIELRRSDGSVAQLMETINTETEKMNGYRAKSLAAVKPQESRADLEKKIRSYETMDIVRFAKEVRKSQSTPEYIRDKRYVSIYENQRKEEIANLRKRLNSHTPSASPAVTAAETKYAAYLKGVEKFFSRSALENSSRLSPAEFVEFSKSAAALRCRDLAYMSFESVAECETGVRTNLINIRNGLRHYQALKLAGANKDYSVPAKMPEESAIDNPKYNFSPTSISQELAQLPICNAASVKTNKDIFLKELCSNRSIIVSTNATEGFQSARLDPKTQKPTGKWYSYPAAPEEKNQLMTQGQHSITVAGYDPANGGYFYLRNSWGTAAGLMRVPVNEVCHLTNGYVLEEAGTTLTPMTAPASTNQPAVLPESPKPTSYHRATPILPVKKKTTKPLKKY